MSKKTTVAIAKHVPIHKKTCQDTTHPKTSSMNKHKKRIFKKYRGQGRP